MTQVDREAVFLDHERAYFERGFFAAYAWMLTTRDKVTLSDAVIEHAWQHRDEGMDGDDILPLPTQSPPPADGVRKGDSLATAKARLSIAAVKALNSGRPVIEVLTDDIAVLIAAHSDQDRVLSTPRDDVREPADAGPVHATDRAGVGTGWVAWNPDSGEEYTPDHPVDSGECVEAERIRRSTPQEDTLWQAMQEQFTRAEALAAALAATQPATAQEGEAHIDARYLIRKGGAFYRPNAQGYTRSKADAGRYTLAEAVSHSHPNGPNGPRDDIDYMPADATTPTHPAVLDDDLVWLSSQRRLSLAFYSPIYGDDDDQIEEWRVEEESGGINDREWNTVGRGATVAEAIASARSVERGAGGAA
ncbi:hypothetical protein ASE75_05930 [Sphingomonas sp. Leaf17]|nr:hypothetical protein ASE75_05930 [Sphingomonas sp. Leaf17]